MLEAAGLEELGEIDGKSFLEILLNNPKEKRKPFHDAVFYGRERATSARPDNVGYPVRTIRTERYELVWNMKPNRYPVGNKLNESEDFAVKAEIIRMKDSDPHSMKIYRDAFGYRPEFELHDMQNDPYGLINLAGESQYQGVCDSLFGILKEKLYMDGDPRLLGRGDVWESYPRFMPVRLFGEANPAYRGVYNEQYVQAGQRIPEYLFDTRDYLDFYNKAGITRDEYIQRLLSKGVQIY
jgi:uncharacterized sulfatase